jgi:hypothetical protein
MSSRECDRVPVVLGGEIISWHVKIGRKAEDACF